MVFECKALSKLLKANKDGLNGLFPEKELVNHRRV